MTIPNICETVVSKYLERLSTDLDVVQSDNGCYLLTPFIRPDGEAIGLEIQSLPNGNFRLSDMGDTFGYLYVNGLTLTRNVLDKTRHIAMGYGVSLEVSALVVVSDPEFIGDAVHKLVQSVLAVTSLIQSRRSISRVLFDKEVESFIIRAGATYDFDYKVQGEREFHKFKFHVNSGRNLLLQPLSANTETTAHAIAERWAYRFMDTVNNDKTWNPIAVLDDRNARRGVWTSEAQAPIKGSLILWAEKEILEKMLIVEDAEAG